ncbi:MAG: M48 family peptidase, partial [Campylobacter sp.]|nr:M48 family peptidase [Campylobacter sp.]
MIFLYALYTIYKISLDLLELSFIRTKLKEPAVVLSEEDYRKAG